MSASMIGTQRRIRLGVLKPVDEEMSGPVVVDLVEVYGRPLVEIGDGGPTFLIRLTPAEAEELVAALVKGVRDRHTLTSLVVCLDCGHGFDPDSSPDIDRCWRCAERVDAEAVEHRDRGPGADGRRGALREIALAEPVSAHIVDRSDGAVLHAGDGAAHGHRARGHQENGDARCHRDQDDGGDDEGPDAHGLRLRGRRIGVGRRHDRHGRPERDEWSLSLL